MIYLDHAATTMVHEDIALAMIKGFHDAFGNPSSLHKAGRAAATLVDRARKQIANCIGAKESEIIFTSGGSESDNLALRGLAPSLKQSGKTTIITSVIEHPAVLNVCKQLELDGFTVIYMPVNSDGCVEIEALDETMQKYQDTLGLVSIMTVNNEIGSVQFISDIGELCQEYHTIFMTDAVQGYGHVDIDVKRDHIDLMSISGHKINAPKGIGILYVRDGIDLAPMIVGGGQEHGLRAGTENVPGILAMAQAMQLAKDRLIRDNDKYWHLRNSFLTELNRLGVSYRVNGDGGIPSIISLTLPGCESEAMLLLLNEQNVYVSAGSACTAGSLEPSHVLRAIGLTDEDASCTIRISMGWLNWEALMLEAAKKIAFCVDKLKAMTGGVRHD